MASIETENDDYIPGYLKSTNTKALVGQNLQICFMNESISDEGENDSTSEIQAHSLGEVYQPDPMKSPKLKERRLNKVIYFY